MPTHRSSYFAYGSNMDLSQMKDRCRTALPEGHGTLKGFRFLINSRGVASIVVDEQATVRGVASSVTDADLESLDR